jgi:hypothetical protein
MLWPKQDHGGNLLRNLHRRRNPFNQYVLSRQSIPFDYPLSRVCHLGENERRVRSRLDAWNGRGFLPNLLRR